MIGKVKRNASRQWKQSRTKQPKIAGTAQPEPPVLRRLRISDTTCEAVANILQHNQRGLLLARDELSGWLTSFNQYKRGRGSDEASWLSAFCRIAVSNGGLFSEVGTRAVRSGRDARSAAESCPPSGQGKTCGADLWPLTALPGRSLAGGYPRPGIRRGR